MTTTKEAVEKIAKEMADSFRAMMAPRPACARTALHVTPLDSDVCVLCSQVIRSKEEG